jgi:hypothetical protein
MVHPAGKRQKSGQSALKLVFDEADTSPRPSRGSQPVSAQRQSAPPKIASASWHPRCVRFRMPETIAFNMDLFAGARPKIHIKLSIWEG